MEQLKAKRRDGAYRSGPRCGWIKTKTNTWREANRERLAALRAALRSERSPAISPPITNRLIG
jgi:hypothetical protein